MKPSSFLRAIKKFIKSEDGPTAMEYAVMVALIVIFVSSSVSFMGDQTKSTFENVDFAVQSSDMNNSDSSTPTDSGTSTDTGTSTDSGTTTDTGSTSDTTSTDTTSNNNGNNDKQGVGSQGKGQGATKGKGLNK